MAYASYWECVLNTEVQYLAGTINLNTYFSQLEDCKMIDVPPFPVPNNQKIAARGIANMDTGITGEDELLVYPNPSTDDQTAIIVKASNSTLIHINLYDVMGRFVKSIELNATTTTGYNQFSFSNADLKSGMYYVKVTGDNLGLQQRITIIK